MLNRPPSNAGLSRGASGRSAIGVDAIAPEEAQSGLDFARYTRMLRRRWKLGAAIAAGFALLVFVLTVVQPRTYTTQIKFIAGSAPADGSAAINPGSALPVLNVLAQMNGGVQSGETYAALMQQPSIADDVIHQLGLSMSASDLLKHIAVRPVTDTSMIQLSVSARDPQTSARIANQYGTTFVEYERHLISHQAEVAVGVLQKQIPDAEARLHAAQDALAAYQERTGIADLPTQETAIVTDLDALRSKERDAEQSKAQAESSLAAVQQQLAQTPNTIEGQRSISSNPVSSSLETTVANLRVQLSAARQQYTDNYPLVISLKAQLAEAERALRSQPQQVLSGTESIPNPVAQQLQEQATTLGSQVAAADSTIDTLKRQIASQEPALSQLPSQARRIGTLQNEVKSAQGVYDALEQKLQDAIISKNIAPSDLTVTSPADASVYTVTPNLGFNLPVGIVIGLILGIAAMFAAEYFDDRFRTEEDVKERLGLPVLATIPQMGEIAEKADPWVKPISLEAFYQLVAALRFASSHPPRTIAFTSPDQGDGKSTIAMNTAISLSMLKARVLVVDADLRRPTMHEKLEVPNDRGLSDVLVGLAKFPDAVQTTSHAGVWVLTSGRPAPNPVGLLQSAAFDRFLRRARERFDFIVIDGPALRSIVDGVILGLKSDGTVLVVSAERSRGRAVEGALQKLRSVGTINLLGVVLNGITLDRREHSEYYLGAGQSISLPSNSNA